MSWILLSIIWAISGATAAPVLLGLHALYLSCCCMVMVPPSDNQCWLPFHQQQCCHPQLCCHYSCSEVPLLPHKKHHSLRSSSGNTLCCVIQWGNISYFKGLWHPGFFSRECGVATQAIDLLQSAGNCCQAASQQTEWQVACDLKGWHFLDSSIGAICIATTP